MNRGIELVRKGFRTEMALQASLCNDSRLDPYTLLVEVVYDLVEG